VGALTLPASGKVYLDANGFIYYTVESIEPYRALLDMVWQAARAGQIKVITSGLTLLEVLVMPLKVGNAAVAATFRSVVLKSPDVQAAPITRAVLEAAARLRATVGLKTPDAIHAATALRAGAALFITNDSAFRRVPGLAVVVLSDLDLPTA
jgi:predicted nucleic acid-binding protein